MELNYDWPSFQSFFYPRRAAQVEKKEFSHPIHLVVENNIVICAFSDGEDLSDWLGSTYQDVSLGLPHREIFIFERSQVDQWIQGSLGLAGFYDQVEFLREHAVAAGISKNRNKKPVKPTLLKAGAASFSNDHFFIEGLQGWWSKVLPNSFGIYISLDGLAGKKVRDIFLLVRRGRLEMFHEPDLSTLGAERSRNPNEVVKYLSERHLVKVQGIFAPAEQWKLWMESEDPWREMARSVKQKKTRIFPLRSTLATLMAARALVRI